MSDKIYDLQRDNNNRLACDIAKGMTLGMKLLSESEVERISRNVHAYAVLDVQTEIGPMRIRDIRVVWNESQQRFKVHFRQFKTGKVREGRSEHLDIVGPQDRETRLKLNEIILDIFQQIRSNVGLPATEVPRTSLGDAQPHLEELRSKLEQEHAES